MSVHYGYDDKGRLTGERQTVENPETGELLWHHETGHAYNEQGLANRVTPDSLPPVEWPGKDHQKFTFCTKQFAFYV